MTSTSADQRSFDDFYVLSRERLGRALALVLNDQDLGFEAVDEAMSRAYKQWDRVSQYENLEGWVFRVALNWARSSLRRARMGRAKQRLAATQPKSADQQIDTDLERAINDLSAEHRAVVVLRFYADWTIDQIADALDLPAGTVKSRLSRAMHALQRKLEQGSDDQ